MECNWKIYVERYLEALHFASGIPSQGRFNWMKPSCVLGISPRWTADRIKRLESITPARISQNGPQTEAGETIWYWKNNYGECIDEAHGGGSSISFRCGMKHDQKVLERILQVRDTQSAMAPGLIEIVSPRSMPWVSREKTLQMIKRLELILEVAD